MNISKRLNRLADMVTEGSRLADVGTDHGYVPIYLMEKGRIPSGIAMDINKGPLERAKCHIREFGYENYIETRLSDGAASLKEGEADTVLIAGMGGGLIIRILAEGEKVLAGVPELILQPQSEVGKVRRYLEEHGYRITKEDIVLDEGKYYPMIKAVHGFGPAGTREELLYGRLKLQRSPQVLRDFLEKSLSVQRQILRSLPKEKTSEGAAGNGRINARRLEVEQEIDALERTLEKLEDLYGKEAWDRAGQEKNYEVSGTD